MHRAPALFLGLIAIGCTFGAGTSAGSGASQAPCPADGLTAVVRIGNSGGGGVAFHRVPDEDPSYRERAYPDDTQLRVLDAPISREGRTYAHVRAPDGVEGYLPVRYLIAEPSARCFVPLPTATATAFVGQRVARVIRVVDGDTLELQLDGRRERVQLIGSSAPGQGEPRQADRCLAAEASAVARRLVPPGASVRVAADPSQGTRDRSNALLLYVWLPNGVVLLNEELIRRGLAREYAPVGPHLLRADFRAAEDEARAERRGVWANGVCGTTREVG